MLASLLQRMARLRSNDCMLEHATTVPKASSALGLALVARVNEPLYGPSLFVLGRHSLDKGLYIELIEGKS
jgi:hypothetical protein